LADRAEAAAAPHPAAGEGHAACELIEGLAAAGASTSKDLVDDVVLYTQPGSGPRRLRRDASLHLGHDLLLLHLALGLQQREECLL
jgi:hypothetical protein